MSNYYNVNGQKLRISQEHAKSIGATPWIDDALQVDEAQHAPEQDDQELDDA